MEFILLINVKMPAIVHVFSILTFSSGINTSENFQARKIFIFQNSSFHQQLKFHAPSHKC